MENKEVLRKFEKEFPVEIVEADPGKRPFQLDDVNMRKMFSIINNMVFDGKLKNITLYSLNNEQISNLLVNEYDVDISSTEMNDHLAFHIIQPYEGVGVNKHRYVKTDKEAIVFNNSNGDCSFGYAVSTLCHEMIHMYDYIFGDALKRAYAKNEYHIEFNEHLSTVFKECMNNARENYDIPVIVDGEGHSYFELNERAQKFFLGLREATSNPNEITETKGNENNYPLVKNKGDGSFVVLGFFDLR